MDILFKSGKAYKRSVLHDEYGGNRQSGISNSRSHPIVFIFTGQSGKLHGYKDGWQDDGYFYYTGEGKEGDMSFARGNKALLDHVVNGKQVHLFKELPKSGYWEYVDQLRLVNYEWFIGEDSNGTNRKAILFKLRSTSVIPDGINDDEEEESHIPPDVSKPNNTERKGLVTSRVGQGWYRSQLLERWNKKCAVTGCDVQTILIASHIVPWRDATDEERLNIDNGILLSPALDALFDRHLISFADNGDIIISDKITSDHQKHLGISSDMKIMGLTVGNKRFLARHRKRMVEKY